jgi:hypothetical protein|tara:strand:- start:422 stop:604 length:183 start_codon:yes stop_codon:yes gene_type:complete
MNEKELTAAAKEMGITAIIKMISAKTAKLREQNDGMVRVADLIDQVVKEVSDDKDTEVQA